MEFAIAPCCWGVYWPTGNHVTWDDYLRKIADAGYRRTELGPYGFGPTNPVQLRQSLADHGIDLVSAAHVCTLADDATRDALRARTRQICELLADCGGRQFILMDESEFYPKDRMGEVNPAQWEEMIEQVACAALIAKGHDLAFGFHPHVGTCVEREDQIVRLLGESDPGLVGLCLDTGHHAYWNADPLRFLERHRDRIVSVHLKNVDPVLRDRVHAENIHPDDAFEIGVMTDLDAGAVDIAALVEDLYRHDFSGPVVVEQDLSEQAVRPPEAIARHNLAFLNSVIRAAAI